METKFNFNSQVCTSRSQSKRLLALGLKKETADMIYSYEREEHENNYYWELDILESPWDSFIWSANGTCIPAWSLHRLVSLCNTDNIKIAFNEKDCWGGNMLRISQRKSFDKDNLYDNLCDCIEWLIKEGYFN